MSVKLRISITKETLEATMFCNSYASSGNQNCAIAYEIRKIWPNAIVGMRHICPFGYDKQAGITTHFPHGQDKFTEVFDYATPSQRAAMQPFSFEIEVPDEVIGEVNIEEIMDIIKNSKTLELVN